MDMTWLFMVNINYNDNEQHKNAPAHTVYTHTNSFNGYFTSKPGNPVPLDYCSVCMRLTLFISFLTQCHQVFSGCPLCSPCFSQFRHCTSQDLVGNNSVFNMSIVHITLFCSLIMRLNGSNLVILWVLYYCILVMSSAWRLLIF